MVSYEVVTSEGQALALGRCDWADWDRDSDLLFAKQGKLFRLKPQQDNRGRGMIELDDARELADFNDQQFEPIPPPRDALSW